MPAYFQTSSDLIAGINNISDPNRITVGQSLTVPAFIYKIVSGDTLTKIAKNFGVTVSEIEKANAGRPGFQKDVIWPDYHLIIPILTSSDIFVTNPLPGTTIKSGQRVEGYARVFEAVVSYQLRDANGVIVARERSVMANGGAPAFGFFSATLPSDRVPTADTGVLWVYSLSAKDGSIINLVKVIVRF
ncbi:Gmad2 immunoglobulin-like domain-containing protein [Fictibacillus enclensis]|uniref:Gmad2 immunoglobulin-like domain-containing protein n=1 Tax=Fictibacillus enclensis TaxID=1017270 RepID=UPI0025A0ACD0|nr:Gmad2 immunoglobulin-like domain-containing protein [Fictibacillus enclensis]MDM5338203.1 Gmad2 immunoglobulin-like domain-containing protein [Fictibacillus enclensis]